MSSLTNFIAPDALKSRFDAVCHAAGRTRTSVLIEMMEAYVFSQSNALVAKARRLNEVDRIIRENHLLSRPDDDQEDGFDQPLYGFVSRAKSVFEPVLPPDDDEEEGWI